MTDLTRVIHKSKISESQSDPHLMREWLVTNGLGGYASGTVTGAITRRYHGLLIAALPNPLGRMMMLNGLSERLRLPDRRVLHTGAEELVGTSSEATLAVSEFRLEAGLPVWRYEVDGFVLEKRLILPYRQNTVHVTYLLLSGKGSLRLGLRPAMHFRSHDAQVSERRSTTLHTPGLYSAGLECVRVAALLGENSAFLREAKGVLKYARLGKILHKKQKPNFSQRLKAR